MLNGSQLFGAIQNTSNTRLQLRNHVALHNIRRSSGFMQKIIMTLDVLNHRTFVHIKLNIKFSFQWQINVFRIYSVSTGPKNEGIPSICKGLILVLDSRAHPLVGFCLNFSSTHNMGFGVKLVISKNHISGHGSANSIFGIDGNTIISSIHISISTLQRFCFNSLSNSINQSILLSSADIHIQHHFLHSI